MRGRGVGGRLKAARGGGRRRQHAGVRGGRLRGHGLHGKNEMNGIRNEKEYGEREGDT